MVRNLDLHLGLPRSAKYTLSWVYTDHAIHKHTMIVNLLLSTYFIILTYASTLNDFWILT